MELFGLTEIDAERLLRFAATATALGILDTKAAWECGFDIDTPDDDETANDVLAVGQRAARYIETNG